MATTKRDDELESSVDRSSYGGSTYDQQYFTDDELASAAAARAAAEAGETDWDSAHAYVEGIRANYGYSGDTDGSRYIPLEQEEETERFSYSSAPTYTSKYSSQIDELTQALLNREAFSYDYTQDPLYHLVKVRIHGVDLSAAALLLGLLLPQLLEQGQVLVKIIGVEHRLIMLGQHRLILGNRRRKLFCFYPLKFFRDLLRRADRAQGAFFCSRNIAAVVGIRKIRPEGVVLSGRLITKSPQPDPFHLMHSQISVDHQRSRLKP